VAALAVYALQNQPSQNYTLAVGWVGENVHPSPQGTMKNGQKTAAACLKVLQRKRLKYNYVHESKSYGLFVVAGFHASLALLGRLLLVPAFKTLKLGIVAVFNVFRLLKFAYC